MANYTGTTGSDTANHSGDLTANTWDYSQGGNDVLTGGKNNDSFFMGSAFWTTPIDFGAGSAVVTPNDVIDGGLGANLLELAGQYYRTISRSTDRPPPATLKIGPGAVRNISTLQLDDGVGFGYRLQLETGIFQADGFDTGYGKIDASRLSAAPVTVDASASADRIAFIAGAGSFYVQGGTSQDTFDLRNGVDDGDHVDGGGGDNYDSVQLSTIRGGTVLNLPDAAFSRISLFYLYADLAYTVTAGDAQTAAGRATGIYMMSPGGTLLFDGSAELDGRFEVVGGGGQDTLIGGAGTDALNGGNIAAGDTLRGGGGDDALSASAAERREVTIDGGAGSDTLTLLLAPDETIVLDPSHISGIEALALNFGPRPDGVFDAGKQYSVVWQDGILFAGQVLPVTLVSTGLHYDFDASAETQGSFIFILPGTYFTGAGGNHWTGGAKGDVFIARNPSANSGPANVWVGGAGRDTLDYSATNTAMTIDAAAGVALGTGSVGDQFSGFERYLFASGNNLFNGAETSEEAVLLGAGRVTVYANGGNDVIRLGATLDRYDVVDGGAGTDTVVLDGDYSAGLALGAATLRGVEVLRLTGGHSYALTANAATVATGGRLSVDGTSLKAGDSLLFDGSAVGSGTFALRGGAGSDTLTGGAIADAIDGSGGADTIVGGGGGDTLTGGRGLDVLTGEDGSDRFVFAARDTAASAAKADLITDFSQAQHDRIDLSAIDADTVAAGVQHFTTIAKGGFKGHVGELVYTNRDGLTLVRGDLDGDGRADLTITLAGTVQLTPDDFILAPTPGSGSLLNAPLRAVSTAEQVAAIEVETRAAHWWMNYGLLHTELTMVV